MQRYCCAARVSNDRFISVEHRVVVNNVSSRISVACFINKGNVYTSTEVYGPIEELVCEDSPAKYRATTIKEYVTVYNSKGLDGTSTLSHFRVWTILKVEILWNMKFVCVNKLTLDLCWYDIWYMIYPMTNVIFVYDGCVISFFDVIC